MSTFPEKKRYEGIRFNVISVTRGCVGVQFPEEKKRYVTLEWPHRSFPDLRMTVIVFLYFASFTLMFLMMLYNYFPFVSNLRYEVYVKINVDLNKILSESIVQV